MNIRVFKKYIDRCNAIGHECNVEELKLYNKLFG